MAVWVFERPTVMLGLILDSYHKKSSLMFRLATFPCRWRRQLRPALTPRNISRPP